MKFLNRKLTNLQYFTIGEINKFSEFYQFRKLSKFQKLANFEIFHSIFCTIRSFAYSHIRP